MVVSIAGNGMPRFAEAIRTLGEGRARTAYSRAINHTGRIAGTAAGRALSAQTGLPASTGRRAIRRKIDRATPSNLSYTIHGRGGNVSLRHFKPRETRKGVSAAPWNSRRVFAGSFMRAGWFPNRVPKPSWNKQVFERGTGGKFRKVKSGLYIPAEMVTGATAAAWNASAARLTPRVAHEIRRVTKGVVT